MPRPFKPALIVLQLERQNLQMEPVRFVVFKFTTESWALAAFNKATIATKSETER